MANTEDQEAPPKKQDADEWLAMQKRYLENLALMREMIGIRMAGLERAVGNLAQFDQLPELLDPSNFEPGSRTRKNKLNAIYQALIDLPAHASSIKTLFEEMTDLYPLERQALEDYKAYSEAAAVDPSAAREEKLDAIAKRYQLAADRLAALKQRKDAAQGP